MLLRSTSILTSQLIIVKQAPGLSFLLPEQYLKYPSTINHWKFCKTGRHFVLSDSVTDGAYDRTKLSLSCINQAIISENGAENNGYSVPLDMMPSGQFEPLYKTTLNVQDGELPVLPLSVYGAVAMAHSEVSEEYSSPYRFFFYRHDKRNSV
ncbi:hypothetical protein PTKIN_Ptkin11bG0203700 [Pterospermum kingtungense]